MTYTVLIADLTNSRAKAPKQRAALQRLLDQLVDELNRAHEAARVSDFEITLGDEFQVVLNDPVVVPDVFWLVEQRLGSHGFRAGVGHGEIATELGRDPGRMDGPAFHEARAAIEIAKREDRLGAVYRGFGSVPDQTLSALTELQAYIRSTWTDRQREVAQSLHAGHQQIEISQTLEISKQAVSKHAAALGWQALHRAEQSQLALLADLRGVSE